MILGIIGCLGAMTSENEENVAMGVIGILVILVTASRLGLIRDMATHIAQIVENSKEISDTLKNNVQILLPV